jgi:hypothetical protein
VNVDRSLVASHLAQAEVHLAQGALHVARQREIVAGLARNGLDTSLANQLLSTFESTQATHLADVDRLKQELAKS